jgi:hypothetical protein
MLSVIKKQFDSDACAHQQCQVDNAMIEIMFVLTVILLA